MTMRPKPSANRSPMPASSKSLSLSTSSGQFWRTLKTKTLPYGVKIEDINWEKEFLFYFSAVSWEWKYIYWDNSWNRQSFTGSLIDINLSFKNSSSQSLQKSINYYTKSNIIDYN